jgi:hypothetical protein
MIGEVLDPAWRARVARFGGQASLRAGEALGDEVDAEGELPDQLGEGEQHVRSRLGLVDVKQHAGRGDDAQRAGEQTERGEAAGEQAGAVHDVAEDQAGNSSRLGLRSPVSMFEQVLPLRERAGLDGVNIVAIDGSKITASASRKANRDYERLAREVIEDTRQTDAQEDEQLVVPARR